VFRARIDRTAAEPTVQLEVIDAVRSASLAYWFWVASGQQVRIARGLAALATERQAGLRTRAEQGDISEIDLVDNERLIASRQAKLIDAERKLDQAAIKLSLFLRDPAGTPLLASESQLPPDFPETRAMNREAEPALITQALATRPELWLLRLERERARVDVQQASNLLLPALDGVVAASQDVGEPTSEKRDKSELELEAGAMLDVPLQRREARGKLQAAQGKLTQVAAKERLTEQKIVVEVQNAHTALAADYEVLQQARRSAELARQMENAERTRFEQGDSNLLNVNIRESAAAEAEALVVMATMDYFLSLANLRAATAAELVGEPPTRVRP
jgi:outer membrane protein TolC